MVFDDQGREVARAQHNFQQYFPKPGWVEHDPDEIWETVVRCCQEALAKAALAASSIAGIGITNQRETTIVWDKNTGKAVYPAIVWQDRRTTAFCQSLQSHEQTITKKTGLVLDPYFSASKIHWILSHVQKLNPDNVLFGTIDTYLLWRLTGGKAHATDATNASRTMLFNIHSQKWDEELCKIFQIPNELLPEVKDTCDNFGVTEKHLFGEEIPILALVGDQQAALVGQGCFKNNDIKSTYGTGCFVMINTGDKVLHSKNCLLSTVAYRIQAKPTYAIEGSIFSAGVIVKWLRDQLGIINKASDSEEIAKNLEDNGGVFLVPAFTGLGAPYWDPDARGAIYGLTRGSRREHIVRAALESIAYQTRDLLLAIEADGSEIPAQLRVDGGMVENKWLMQFLADILDLPIKRAVLKETTALGASFLAGFQAGIYPSLDVISQLCDHDADFKPLMSMGQRKELYSQWLASVRRTRS